MIYLKIYLLMNNYCSVTITHIDIESGNKINSLLESNQLIYNIIKNKNIYSLDFIINNYDIDMNKVLYNNLMETFCIITEEDYKSLISLMYNDAKQLINYNDNYYIIKMEIHFNFKSNSNQVNEIKKKFN